MITFTIYADIADKKCIEYYILFNSFNRKGTDGYYGIQVGYNKKYKQYHSRWCFISNRILKTATIAGRIPSIVYHLSIQAIFGEYYDWVFDSSTICATYDLIHQEMIKKNKVTLTMSNNEYDRWTVTWDLAKNTFHSVNIYMVEPKDRNNPEEDGVYFGDIKDFKDWIEGFIQETEDEGGYLLLN
jgi:hypothetical protein